MTILHNFKIFLEQTPFSELFIQTGFVSQKQKQILLDSLPLIQRNFKFLALVINNTGHYIYLELSFLLHSTNCAKAPSGENLHGLNCQQYYSARKCTSTMKMYIRLCLLSNQNISSLFFELVFLANMERHLNALKPRMN